MKLELFGLDEGDSKFSEGGLEKKLRFFQKKLSELDETLEKHISTISIQNIFFQIHLDEINPSLSISCIT